MFGNKRSNGYTDTNSNGTSYLQNTIRAKVYSGDSILERKLAKCQLYWKYYNNQHWAKNNDQLLSFNYVRAVIDKVNNFIIGKAGFEVNISDTYGDEIAEPLEKSFEGILNYNWVQNKKKTFLQKALQMGSICGDLYIFCSPNTIKGFVEYSIIDSRTVIPKFNDGNYSDVIGYKVVKVLGSNEEKFVQKVTEYAIGTVTTYYVKETGENAEKFRFVQAENDYDFIPIVHIENIPMSDAYGGKSDMEDIAKINKIYNEMSEDVKNIIDYYAQPTTVITGGTVGQLKRGINQIWSGLPSDASVFNLSLGEDLSATTNFLASLKNAIHDLSGVPEEVLSKVQHISNTSASALQMLYQPIIQISDKKSVSYGEGIEELNRMTMIIYSLSLANHPLYSKLPEEAKAKPKTFFNRYKAETVWKYNLPNDRLGILNEATIELKQGLGSRREIMERLGKKAIPKLMVEIEGDSKRAVDLELAKKPKEPKEATQNPVEEVE